MNKAEVEATYPILDLFDHLITYVTDYPLESNVTQTKQDLLDLVLAARKNAAPQVTPRYDIFLTVLRYCYWRIDAVFCQEVPQMVCDWNINKDEIMSLYDFGVFD